MTVRNRQAIVKRTTAGGGVGFDFIITKRQIKQLQKNLIVKFLLKGVFFKKKIKVAITFALAYAHQYMTFRYQCIQNYRCN